MIELVGSFVAIVTPFKNGKIDKESLKCLIEFHVENGTDGIVVCGTTGEAATLSHEEQHSMMELAIEYSANRLPVICGAGSNNTSEALSLARHAAKVGGAAVLVITPYYNKPTVEGLYQHFKTISDNVDLPIILYNVPSRTGTNMLPETVKKISELENVIALKEASGNIGQVSEIIRQCSGEITLLSGDDLLTYPMLCLGAKGVISVVANIVPKLMSRMVHAAVASKYAEARELHYSLSQLEKSMFIETNPIPVKTVLSWMGKINEEFRLPMVPMQDASKKKLKAVVQKYGLI